MLTLARNGVVQQLLDVTSFGSLSLTAGDWDLDFVQIGSVGSAAPVLKAVAGSKSSFDSSFKTLGDLPSGGLAVTQLPSAAAAGFLVEVVQADLVAIPKITGFLSTTSGQSLNVAATTAAAAELTAVDLGGGDVGGSGVSLPATRLVRKSGSTTNWIAALPYNNYTRMVEIQLGMNGTQLTAQLVAAGHYFGDFTRTDSDLTTAWNARTATSIVTSATGNGLGITGLTGFASGTMTSLADGTALLDDSSKQKVRASAELPVLNVVSGAGQSGRFKASSPTNAGLLWQADRPLPLSLRNQNKGSGQVAVRVTGLIEIPSSGTWSFGVSSSDPFSLTLTRGSTIRTITGDGSSDRFQTFTFSSAETGAWSLEIKTIQAEAPGQLELFATAGTKSAFGDGSGWALVGAPGGLVAYRNRASTEVITPQVSGWNDKAIRIPIGAIDNVLRVVSQGAPSTWKEAVGSYTDTATATYAQASSERQAWNAYAQDSILGSVASDTYEGYGLINSAGNYRTNTDSDGKALTWTVGYQAGSGQRQFQLVDGRRVNATRDPAWTKTTASQSSVDLAANVVTAPLGFLEHASSLNLLTHGVSGSAQSGTYGSYTSAGYVLQSGLTSFDSISSRSDLPAPLNQRQNDQLKDWMTANNVTRMWIDRQVSHSKSVVFSNDFESSTNGFTVYGNPQDRRDSGITGMYLGRFGGQSGKDFAWQYDLDSNFSYEITYDLFILDSWDNEKLQTVYKGTRASGGDITITHDEYYTGGTNKDTFTLSFSGSLPFLGNYDMGSATFAFKQNSKTMSRDKYYDQVSSVTITIPKGYTHYYLDWDPYIENDHDDESLAIDTFVLSKNTISLPSGYTNFTAPEPNNLGGDETAIEIWNSGGWNDISPSYSNNWATFRAPAWTDNGQLDSIYSDTREWESRLGRVDDTRSTLNYSWVSNETDIFDNRPKFRTYDKQTEVVKISTVNVYKSQPVYGTETTTRSVRIDGAGVGTEYEEFSGLSLDAGTLNIHADRDLSLIGRSSTSGNASLSAGRTLDISGRTSTGTGGTTKTAITELTVGGTLNLTSQAALNLAASSVVTASGVATLSAGTNLALAGQLKATTLTASAGQVGGSGGISGSSSSWLRSTSGSISLTAGTTAGDLSFSDSLLVSADDLSLTASAGTLQVANPTQRASISAGTLTDLYAGVVAQDQLSLTALGTIAGSSTSNSDASVALAFSAARLSATSTAGAINLAATGTRPDGSSAVVEANVTAETLRSRGGSITLSSAGTLTAQLWRRSPTVGPATQWPSARRCPPPTPALTRSSTGWSAPAYATSRWARSRAPA
jgi:hypothetical protein